MPHLRSKSSLSVERQPVLYMAAAFTGGIVVDRLFPWPPRFALWAAVIVASLALILVMNKVAPVAATGFLLVSFALFGSALSALDRISAAPDRLLSLYDSHTIAPDDPVALTGVLTRPPEPIPDGCLLDVEAEQVSAAGQDLHASGKARLMLSPDGEEGWAEYRGLGLDYGRRVRILVRLARAQTYNNPGAIDFNEFLQRRGYDLKGTIKSPLLIENVGQAKANPVLGALYHFRLRVMTALDAHFDRVVSGSLKAMLMDNRYFLDNTVAERLREGGVFHVLVIAGLHIGIIAWILLGSRGAAVPRHAIRIVLALAVLWSYTVMVGLAPPVTRTMIMITVGVIGPMLLRRSISLNTVAIAAFVMLALDPTLVADAGFQLSFTAVGGIIALVLPLTAKLQQIGQWRPTPTTPHPPRCPKIVKTLSECMFWNERQFQSGNARAQVKYKLDKSSLAVTLSRWRLQPIIRDAALLFITSAIIQLVTLPLMVYYFNRVSPIGVVLNVVAGLLTGALMIGAAATILASPVSRPLGLVLARLVTAAHNLLVNSAAPFSRIPGATFRAPEFTGSWTAIYVIYFLPLILIAVLIDRWRPVDEMLSVGPSPAPNQRTLAGLRATPLLVRTRLAWVSIVLLSICLVLVLRPFGSAAKGSLTIYFLDVGQGDSALIIFPRGATMLVDGGGEIHINRRPMRGGAGATFLASGPQSESPQGETAGSEDEAEFSDSGLTIGEAVVSRFLWSLGLRRLDYVLATHAHEDHIGGLRNVLRNFQVGELIVGHAPGSDADYRRLAKAAARQHVAIGTVSQGEGFELDGVKVDVLWPLAPAGDHVTSGNNDSIVLRLVDGSVSFLLTGDAERPAEEQLAASGIDLKADLIKAGHHGSKTSSSDEFLDKVQPRYAVVSVGIRSRFGHPNKEVLDRFQARGVRLLWTGRDGMVTANTDGSTLSVSSYGTANH
jgi:competence protein ComEC